MSHIGEAYWLEMGVGRVDWRELKWYDRPVLTFIIVTSSPLRFSISLVVLLNSLSYAQLVDYSSREPL